ncbi:MAG: J domain-containing protein [Spirochaetaceae bacterium]|nr:MAG: J domain-containing protein [Spirochaetaceae bacterium]
MEYKDYYKILGVGKNATKEEIKKAYRKLAREHHPDINPDNKQATARFAEINEANEVLSDDQKRKKYDQLGTDWQKYQSTGQKKDFDWSRYGFGDGESTAYSSGDFDDLFGRGAFSDFFNNLFGTGGSSGRSHAGKISMKGADYHAELPLDLEDAYAKCVKTITLNGRSMRITLEPGMRDNQTIKLNGKGGPGVNGGENGDLYITLKIKLNPVYRRDENDLFMDVPISFYKAVLGGEHTVNTLSGRIKLKIKPETKNNTILRVKGRGFPVYRKKGEYGDLYIKLVLETPQGLSNREQELVKELARIKGEK